MSNKSELIISVGHKNFVILEKILGIIPYDSKPVRDIVREAMKIGKVMDSTAGKKTKSVVLLVGGHLVLSGLESVSIADRISPPREKSFLGEKKKNDKRNGKVSKVWNGDGKSISHSKSKD